MLLPPSCRHWKLPTQLCQLPPKLPNKLFPQLSGRSTHLCDQLQELVCTLEGSHLVDGHQLLGRAAAHNLRNLEATGRGRRA